MNIFKIVILFTIVFIVGELYTFHHHIAFSLAFEATILYLCSNYSTKWKLILFPFLLCWIIQFLNIIFTGNLLEPLTLLNLNHYKGIGIKNIVISIFVLTSIGVFWWIRPFTELANRKLSPSYTGKRKYLLLFLVLILEFVFKNTFPIHAMIHSIKKSYIQKSYQLVYNDGSEFQKKYAYKKSNFSNKYTKNKNIILIFQEGMSSNVISPDLTPNIYSFIQESISFNNYFNHTAATYRGINGQLMSGFQLLGGYNKENNGFAEINKSSIDEKFSNPKESLPVILAREGYKTIFVSPHVGSFNDYIRHIGFQSVLSAEKINLEDSVMYDKLFESLELQKPHEKFFIVTYLHETHLGLDSSDKKYKDGKNEYLNKWYNTDYHFGRFLKKFKTSKHFDNTILVFTTDHASYPSVDFIKTFNSKSKIFADNIPLIIYNKNIQPEKLDAKHSNSLRLAPTLLNILDINPPNHFLGHSLFEETKIDKEERLYVEGFDCYINKNGEFVKIDFFKECNTVKRFYDYNGF